MARVLREKCRTLSSSSEYIYGRVLFSFSPSFLCRTNHLFSNPDFYSLAQPRKRESLTTSNASFRQGGSTCALLSYISNQKHKYSTSLNRVRPQTSAPRGFPLRLATRADVRQASVRQGHPTCVPTIDQQPETHISNQRGQIHVSPFGLKDVLLPGYSKESTFAENPPTLASLIPKDSTRERSLSCQQVRYPWLVL